MFLAFFITTSVLAITIKHSDKSENMISSKNEIMDRLNIMQTKFQDGKDLNKVKIVWGIEGLNNKHNN